ncbi:MAG TPA: hypothetical protein EYP36_06095 [Calditrichaeota bacterium]|nr:hypothetical protein [Calditrichota bacterium]
MTEIKFHESAEKHVSGEAVYVDDIVVSEQLLYGKVVYSPHARARIKAIYLDDARKLRGVHAVLSAANIPGQNQMGPVVHDEPCLAENEVQFIGQAVVLIAAESEEICRRAEQLIRIEYDPLPAVLTIDQAMQQNQLLGPERKIERGAPDDMLEKAS